MRVDPATGFPLSPEARGADRLQELERRVSALERQSTIQETAGVPTTAARNGTPGVDSTAPKLWVRRNGAWVFATLSG